MSYEERWQEFKKRSRIYWVAQMVSVLALVVGLPLAVTQFAPTWIYIYLFVVVGAVFALSIYGYSRSFWKCPRCQKPFFRNASSRATMMYPIFTRHCMNCGLPKGEESEHLSPIGDTSVTLISEDYRLMQQELHKNPDYGTASVGYAPLVRQVMEAVGATELLDYGAGKGRLGITLRGQMQQALTLHHYDPAIPEWSAPAQPCHFVACIDVLEHIEPDLIDNVLDDLKRVTLSVGVFTVHTGAAIKVLMDGRNAHLIQQPPSWWLLKLLSRFDLVQFNRMPQGFWVYVERKRG